MKWICAFFVFLTGCRTEKVIVYEYEVISKKILNPINISKDYYYIVQYKSGFIRFSDFSITETYPKYSVDSGKYNQAYYSRIDSITYERLSPSKVELGSKKSKPFSFNSIDQKFFITLDNDIGDTKCIFSLLESDTISTDVITINDIYINKYFRYLNFSGRDTTLTINNENYSGWIFNVYIPNTDKKTNSSTIEFEPYGGNYDMIFDKTSLLLMHNIVSDSMDNIYNKHLEQKLVSKKEYKISSKNTDTKIEDLLYDLYFGKKDVIFKKYIDYGIRSRSN
ncbi:MAG: hypothetical protein H6600_02820 [Flavobacteriales bacterium]|nr:hypothetical protein [Flavobacteriales bacterium]MCB9197363.1 hypothetical protein [Flavobacteriales bacterium]